MNLLALAAATTLRLLDPTGDAAGDGTLLPPTSPAYANVSVFDLQEVALVPGASEDEPVTLAVSMGSVELTDALPAGFNKVVSLRGGLNSWQQENLPTVKGAPKKST